MPKRILFKKKMEARDIHETHRVASPLELFFDLVFVIAVAAAASGLHHALAGHQISSGIINFFIAFFGIWWGWMNYTWFASAFDNDDNAFRIYTMFQMFGVMIMAVGIPDVFSDDPSIFLVTIGYTVMRVAMGLQWLRAASSCKQNKKLANVCYRYAFGILFVQMLWQIRATLLPAEWQSYLTPVLMLAELSVPLFAERDDAHTPWHAHHIAERFGLLTIIVLGEGLLGVTNTAKTILSHSDSFWDVFPLGTGLTALLFCLWWIYFNQPYGHVLSKKRTLNTAIVFGYWHFFIFIALTAIGSALELIADAEKPLAEQGHHIVTPLFAATAMAISTTVYLVAIAMLYLRFMGKNRTSLLGLLFAVLSPILPILAVMNGLSLAWAAWLGIIFPLMMTKLYQPIAHHHGH